MSRQASASVAENPPAVGIPIFDGHNDTLLNLPSTGRSFFERGEHGHIDLPRARAGQLAGGFFAVFVRDPGVELDGSPAADDDDSVDRAAVRATQRYSDPDNLPPPMSLDYAQRATLATIAQLFRIEAEAAGRAKVVRTAGELRTCLETGVFAMELHIEGAEAIDPGLDALEVYYAAGLRSLGITWSRPNIFASGVPFKFPSSPDTGPGLTDLGKDLVRACNRLGIMLDLSHLNEQGFWDVAGLTGAPLVATHSNAHAICPSARNLTDKQLAAIRESDGMVGLNFHVGFLRPDGQAEPDLPLSIMVDHIDHLVEHLGEDRVGFGSDFDGALMPGEIKDAAGLPRLVAALRDRGYDDATLRKLGTENWVRVLKRTWGA
ncbi:MAG: dipeptidase [Chloroflexota bacterium]|nr:dipeptidase [Chloroflexota bacterium]